HRPRFPLRRAGRAQDPEVMRRTAPSTKTTGAPPAKLNIGEATFTLLPLREKVAGAKRRSDEGCAASASPTAVCAEAQRTPHPPLRGTFSLKGRREAAALA